jgi:hypothetical protein
MRVAQVQLAGLRAQVGASAVGHKSRVQELTCHVCGTCVTFVQSISIRTNILTYNRMVL